MTGFIPKEKLTAYQRWEVAAFDEAEQAARQAAKEAAARAELPAQVVAEPEPVVLPTAADIERMHAEAHEEGYAAGYEEGIAEARQIAERIDAMMSDLQQSLDQIDQAIAEQLLATAVGIAQQVVRQSLHIKPELLLPVVREAIDALYPLSGNPMLYVHPDDAELIRTHLGEALEHKNWRIVEDHSLSPGGCRIEHGGSEVDATKETRWRRVIEAMGITEAWLEGKP